jgi:hypothetical protein
VVCQTVVNSTIPELSNTYSELEISNDSDNESTDNIWITNIHIITNPEKSNTVIIDNQEKAR